MVAQVRSARFKMLIRVEHSPLWPADSLRLLLLLLDVLTHPPSPRRQIASAIDSLRLLDVARQ
eukprot:7088927-Prymnesium_polylepis.1